MRIDLWGLGESREHGTAINMLPDEVLVEIFDACRMNETGLESWKWKRARLVHGLEPWKWTWVRLVHVCRRWRQIIFSSPRRLNVQLFCTHRTPVAEKLACWPAFPIALQYSFSRNVVVHEDHIIAALEYPDRVCHIQIDPINLRTAKVASFPALPTFLSTACDLVNLELIYVPWKGFLSPEKIVKGVATATRLQRLCIEYSKPHTPADFTSSTHSLPPLTRTTLPSLTSLELCSTREYLEDFVAQVDVPQLRLTNMMYFHQNDLRVPELLQFIKRSEGARLTQFKRVDITLNDGVTFDAYHESQSPTSSVIIGITSCGTKRRAPYMVQFLSQFSFCHVDYLYIRLDWGSRMKINNGEWLELLHLFTAVRALHVSEKFAKQLSVFLKSVTAEMGILPALELLCVENHSMSVDKFVNARRLSGHPITIVDTLREFDEVLESYSRK